MSGDKMNKYAFEKMLFINLKFINEVKTFLECFE